MLVGGFASKNKVSVGRSQQFLFLIPIQVFQALLVLDVIC